MRLYLAEGRYLKLIETPCVYDSGKDGLYELDEEAFELLCGFASPEGREAEEDDFIRYCLDEGLLAASPPGNPLRPAVFRQSSPSLRYLELQITRRCNLRCRHCYLGPPEDSELSVPEVESVLSEFERMQGLRVLLTGGEPLLHSGFDRLNDALPRYALRKALLTNGTLLGGQRLRGLNVQEIQVSLDGLEKGHESIRGRGTFRKAAACIEGALSAGFDVSVATMIHSGNLGEFEGVQRMLESMGVREWTVDVPCPEGNLKRHPALLPPPEEAGRFLGYGFGDGPHGGGGGYACGPHLMSVSAEGLCAKCAYYSQNPVGNINEGLAVCWGRIKRVRLEDLECRCDVLEECRGGCRYRASLLGSPLGRDLYRCALYGKMGHKTRREVDL